MGNRQTYIDLRARIRLKNTKKLKNALNSIGSQVRANENFCARQASEYHLTPYLSIFHNYIIIQARVRLKSKIQFLPQIEIFIFGVILTLKYVKILRLQI